MFILKEGDYLTREDYIKELIKQNGLTIKEYAAQIQIPYSTLLTMINEQKLGKAAIDSVIKICQGLNITVDDLQNATGQLPMIDHIVLSEHEKLVIEAYRQKQDLQKAIDILLFSQE